MEMELGTQTLKQFFRTNEVNEDECAHIMK
jgi:hypothetical protein